MNATHVSPCTCFRLRKLSRLASQRYDRHLAGVGLNLNQYSLLRHLSRQDWTSVELAHALGMERTTLLRALQPLVAAGWVEQAHGKRQHRLVITAQGRDALSEAVPHWRKAQDEIYGLLGGDGTAALHAQLDALLARLQETA